MSEKTNCCGDCETCNNETVQEEIRLDQDVYNGLIHIFVRQNLLPESNQVFNDCISDGIALGDAIGHAIVNEMANVAMERLVTNLKYADELIAKGKAIQARYTFNNKNNKEDNTDDNTPEDEISR